MEKLKEDQTFLRNKPAILAAIKDHSFNLGKIQAMKERANISDPNNAPAAGGGGSVVPKTMNDAIKASVGM
jgi:hypothetical protein